MNGAHNSSMEVARLQRRRLFESCLAFLCAGLMFGTAATAAGGVAVGLPIYVCAAVWLLCSFWRITSLNDKESKLQRENEQSKLAERDRRDDGSRSDL